MSIQTIIKSIRPTAKAIGKTIEKNLPSILTWTAVATVIPTAIETARATLEAKEKIEEAEEKKRDKLTPSETVAAVWTCYIPSVILGSITITSIIMSNSINQKRNLALAGVYSATESAFKEYREKTERLIGKSKATEIDDEICRDIVESQKANDGPIHESRYGSYLCYDGYSKQRFQTSIEHVRKVVNDVNQAILTNYGFYSLNDFYADLDAGLEYIPAGWDIGWDYEHLLDVHYSTQLSPWGEPCLVLKYEVYPKSY